MGDADRRTPEVSTGSGSDRVNFINIEVNNTYTRSLPLPVLTLLPALHQSLIILAALPLRNSPFSALRVSTTSGARSITRR